MLYIVCKVERFVLTTTKRRLLLLLLLAGERWNHVYVKLSLFSASVCFTYQKSSSASSFLSRPPSRSRKPLRLAEDILRLASRLAATSRLAAAYGWNRLTTDYRRSRSKHFVGGLRHFCLTVNATNLSGFAAVRPCVIQMIVIIIIIIIIIIRQQLSWNNTAPHCTAVTVISHDASNRLIEGSQTKAR